MAERHVRAVQLHSKLSDRLTRNILEIIALDIGREGQPAYTSNRTIAERARCAVNTARERIEDILKSKELIRSIEGRYSVYSLNPELIPYDSVAEETHEDGGVTAQFARIDDLAAMEKRMYQNIQDCINPLYQLYQTIVSNVSVNQRADNTEDIGKKKEKNIYTPPDTKEIAQIKSALARVVKTPQWDKTKDEYDAAAVLLIGWDATPETIAKFGEWWKANGWHSGLPELSTLVKEYRNFLAGVKLTKSQPNGKPVDTPEFVQTWQTIQGFMSSHGADRKPELSPDVENLVRKAGGWHRLCMMHPTEAQNTLRRFCNV